MNSMQTVLLFAIRRDDYWRMLQKEQLLQREFIPDPISCLLEEKRGMFQLSRTSHMSGCLPAWT